MPLRTSAANSSLVAASTSMALPYSRAWTVAQPGGSSASKWSPMTSTVLARFGSVRRRS